ncbi:hypothetical protein R5R35_001419 [Gryllus longicercus]|uniref:SUZ RNA-binding domain-containing n=1 Tax=Gryllus longicercus TaxID=2509291 RepID=A0AAN9Z8W5_9ORTH
MAASEDVLESWEDIEDSGVLDKKLQPSVPPQEECENMRRGTSNGPIIIQDETLRNHYVPPEPTVKILKRPNRNLQGSGDGPLLNGDAKPRQPIKTLQQREQEYAEARLRILGEARSPEEQVQLNTDDRVSKIQTKMEVLRASDMANVVRLPKGPDGSKGFNIRR